MKSLFTSARIRFPIAVLLSLCLTLIMTTEVYAAPEEIESCQGDTSYALPVYGNTWYAQTFTPEFSHTVTLVKLHTSSMGTPGHVRVSLMATEEGKPKGPELVWTEVENPSTAWPEWVFPTAYEVTSGKTYAIVLRAEYGNSSNNISWFNFNYDKCSGNIVYTTSGGSFWTINTYGDLTYQVWGEPIKEEPSLPSTPSKPPTTTVGGDVFPVNKVSLLAPWIVLAVVTLAGSIVMVRRRARSYR